MTSITASSKTPEPLMLTPNAALKLLWLVMLMFESARGLDCILVVVRPLDGEMENILGLKVVEDKFARFFMMSDVPLKDRLGGTFFDPRFFFTIGPALAYSMRSLRMYSWKLTNAKTLSLPSAEPVESPLSDLVKFIMLACFLASALPCLFSCMAPFLAVLTSAALLSLALCISQKDSRLWFKFILLTD